MLELEHKYDKGHTFYMNEESFDIFSSNGIGNFHPKRLSLHSGEYTYPKEFFNLKSVIVHLLGSAKKIKYHTYHYELHNYSHTPFLIEAERNALKVIYCFGNPEKKECCVALIRYIPEHKKYSVDFDKSYPVSNAFKKAICLIVKELNSKTKTTATGKKRQVSEVAKMYKEAQKRFQDEFNIAFDRNDVPYKRAIQSLSVISICFRAFRDTYGRDTLRVGTIRMNGGRNTLGEVTLGKTKKTTVLELGVAKLENAVERVSFVDTIFHELGHVVEYIFFEKVDKNSKDVRSEQIELLYKDTLFVGKVNTYLSTNITNVREYLENKEIKRNNFVSYLIQKDEMFARAFAQYWVVRSGIINREMLAGHKIEHYGKESDDVIDYLVKFVTTMVKVSA